MAICRSLKRGNHLSEMDTTEFLGLRQPLLCSLPSPRLLYDCIFQSFYTFGNSSNEHNEIDCIIFLSLWNVFSREGVLFRKNCTTNSFFLYYLASSLIHHFYLLIRFLNLHLYTCRFIPIYNPGDTLDAYLDFPPFPGLRTRISPVHDHFLNFPVESSSQ